MILCVVGPTGVGKTKLSVMLAKKYDAIVVNADACQIYRELNIGTAKIKEEEKEGVTHILFDHCNPDEEYSVMDYQKDLRDVLNKYQDKNIILVGGTGLYIKAGLYDYQFAPLKEIDLSKYSNEELYEQCKQIDKNIDIHVNNRRRLENIVKRQNTTKVEPKLLYNVKFIGLTTEREHLYEIINNRVDVMIKSGLVDEVQELYEKYGKNGIVNQAIGYKEIITYLDGESTLDDSVELIKKNSRHYAKRQYTWFNNQMDVTWFNVDFKNFNNTFEEVVKYIEE